MKNKQKQKQKVITKAQAYAKRQRNGTKGPVQLLGGVVGGIAGMAMGGPLGAGIGASLGSAFGNGIGYITGSGDYKVASNACTVPGFRNSDSTVITHREYITDIKSGATLSGASTTFDIQKFPLQPGDASTFPWLASIAANYEEYDIQGMVFAYVATSGESVASTNTALGTVILATEYDPTKPDFANKQAMENYSFATSSKPSSNQLHAVECAKVRTPVKQLYIRHGTTVGNDIRWSDFGNFYIATVGCPAVGTTLGELWVTYKVKLIKPRLPVTVGQVSSGLLTRSGCTTAVPMGTNTLLQTGALAVEFVSNTTFRFKALPNMDYLVNVYQYGTGFTAVSFPTITSGATFKALYKAKTNSFASAFDGSNINYAFRVECNNTDTDGHIVVAVSLTAGTASMDIVVAQTDETL